MAFKPTPDPDAGISVRAHPPGPPDTIKEAPAEFEPERSAGASFSLGGIQLPSRERPTFSHTADAAGDTSFEMHNLSVTAQVETPSANAQAAKYEDSSLQSSIRRRQAPQ